MLMIRGMALRACKSKARYAWCCSCELRRAPSLIRKATADYRSQQRHASQGISVRRGEHGIHPTFQLIGLAFSPILDLPTLLVTFTRGPPAV